MTPRRKIEMVVEQDEIILVRRRRGAVRLWCNRCEEQVSMLRVEDASALVGVTARTIYRWIEAGRLHFAESDKGLVLICAQSLASFISADRTAEGKRACSPLKGYIINRMPRPGSTNKKEDERREEVEVFAWPE